LLFGVTNKCVSHLAAQYIQSILDSELESAVTGLDMSVLWILKNF